MQWTLGITIDMDRKRGKEDSEDWWEVGEQKHLCLGQARLRVPQGTWAMWTRVSVRVVLKVVRVDEVQWTEKSKNKAPGEILRNLRESGDMEKVSGLLKGREPLEAKEAQGCPQEKPWV